MAEPTQPTGDKTRALRDYASEQLPMRVWGWITSLVAGGASGAGVLVSAEEGSSAGWLEALDRALSVQLFLGVGAICLGVSALLMPRFFELAENGDPGNKSREQFWVITAILERFTAAFLCCLLGAAFVFGFDGILEHCPPGAPAGPDEAICSSLGGSWADVVEGVGGAGLLGLVMVLLLFGAIEIFTPIQRVKKTFPRKEI